MKFSKKQYDIEWFILEISEAGESIGNESDGTDDNIQINQNLIEPDISEDSDISEDYDCWNKTSHFSTGLYSVNFNIDVEKLKLAKNTINYIERIKEK